MKLTIFGASGRTGTRLTEQALAAGHDVVAVMRNPAKLTLRHERLRIAHGDLTDAAAVEDAVRGADAVLAALNFLSEERRRLRGRRFAIVESGPVVSHLDAI
jgi:putative NADH-flavin reductase